MAKSWFRLVTLSLITALLATIVPAPMGAPVQLLYAATEPISDLELIRNGGFDSKGANNAPTGWVTSGTGSGIADTAGQDGGPAMGVQAITEGTAELYQELRLPTTTTAMRVLFDLRVTLLNEPPGNATGAFQVGIVTENDTLALLAEPTIEVDSGWQSFSADLTAQQVTAVQNAHAAGEAVFIYFLLQQSPANLIQVFVDNVSVVIDGQLTIPELAGAIGYVGLDANGNPTYVKRINPDKSGEQTLFTHPSTSPFTNRLPDVAWNPDATELAFSSNHEDGYSAFQSDAYGIRPDGSDLRRITNPPSRSSLDQGAFQFGTVTGVINNDFGLVSPFLIYIEGAKEPVSVNVGGLGSTVGFTVPDVADLGTGLHYVVFAFSDTTRANCREFVPAIVDVVAGQSVDVGTVSFNGTCGTYNVDSITWKADGSLIGVDLVGPRQFLATGQTIGTDLFSGAPLASTLDWSPIDDQIVYVNRTFAPATAGLYVTTANGNEGTRVVPEDGALQLRPAWLPDGSGFVYTKDNEIRQYLFAGQQDTLLANFYNDTVDHPSVSPDGSHVVFEWRTSAAANDDVDLWIMNLTNPKEMWALTTDGSSTNPDWSRKDPTSPGPGCIPVASASISGPTSGVPGQDYDFTASAAPTTATMPFVYVWAPAPSSGQGTSQATYSWQTTGDKSVQVEISNCGGSATQSTQATISITDGTSQPSSKTFLPILQD